MAAVEMVRVSGALLAVSSILWIVVAVAVVAVLAAGLVARQARHRSGRVDRGTGQPAGQAPMSLLLRASTLPGRPVVTLAGERVAELKDVVFDSAAGAVVGFTLRDPGFWSRRRHEVLAWSSVHGLGRDAVMIAADDDLAGPDGLDADGVADDRDVLGNRVLTNTGIEVGTVVDVVVEVDGRRAAIIGYEVRAAEAMATGGRLVLVPLPSSISVSGEHVVVPEAAVEYVGQDLSGFGAAVADFRALLSRDQR